MKATRKILALLLCIVLCAGMFPAAAFAEADFGEASAEKTGEPTEEQNDWPESTETAAAEDTSADREAQALATLEELISNKAALAAANGDELPEPVEILEEPVYVPEETVTNEAAYAAGVYTTPEEAGAYIREQMVARETTITFSFIEPDDGSSTFIDAAIAAAFSHTGNPAEGDYLKNQYTGFSGGGSYSRSSADSAWIVTYTLTISYRTTAGQEKTVAADVEQVFKDLGIDSLQTPYEKIKAIYVWMCSNIDYDYDHLYDSSYTLKYTAYAAIENKTSVCMGYALLFYYMALRAGIDVRYITGTGNGGGHAWDIVKLGDVYYNVDATWDSNHDASFDLYSYFMKSDVDFDDHTRDAEFLTDAFYKAYPMADESYYEQQSYGTCGTNLQWSYSNGTLYITGTGAMTNWNSSNNMPWVTFRPSIRNIEIADGVTSIGTLAFSYHTALTKITIPASVVKIGTFAFIGCSGLKRVVFEGNAPTFGTDVFDGDTLTACYYSDASNWTSDVTVNHGGTITWLAVMTGDVNADKAVNLKDLLMLKNALADDTVSELTCPEGADISRDSVVNLADLLELKRTLAGVAG